MRTAEKDVDERPPPSGNPETLDEQLQLVQAQRAWLGDGNRWQGYRLIVILYFTDSGRPPEPFTFISLLRFDAIGDDPSRIWITGVAREHPPNTKQEYSIVTKISSRVVQKKIDDN